MEIKITLCLQEATVKFFSRRLETIERLLIEIKRQGENTMSQLDDLNAAITAEDVSVQQLIASVAKIGADVDALLAKITGGASPEDLSTQIAAIQSHTAALATAAAQLGDADTKANA